MGSTVRVTSDTLHFLTFCGMAYFSVVTTTVTLTSLLYTMPVVYDASTGVFWWRVVAAVFILVGIVANFAMVSIRHSFLPSDGMLLDLPGADWNHCVSCNRAVPPKTHHCLICQRCILWRDHHCFFTGSCVGIKNQRYFVLFCVYCCLGSAYSLYVNTTFLELAYFTPFSAANVVHFFLPVTIINWLFGWKSRGFVYFVFMEYISLFTALGAGGIALWQLLIIAHGQTSHEYWNLGRRGQLSLSSILRNMRNVFGPYWFLKFLFPFPLDGHFGGWNASKVV